MDLRTYLFEPLTGRTYTAVITATEPGLLAGGRDAQNRAVELGLRIQYLAADRLPLQAGTAVLRVAGSAEQMARGEEELLACFGKASGVATTAARFVAQTAGRARIVCGAWKKVAREQRALLRSALNLGGAGMRLLDQPFIYLDKNYVRMFGDIGAVVRRARSFDGRMVAVQLRGESATIREEARQAIHAGAAVVMIDTGNITDLQQIVTMAQQEGFRQQVQIAFGGGVDFRNLHRIIAAGANIIDVGRAIIDAPLLDFRFDVEPSPTSLQKGS